MDEFLCYLPQDSGFNVPKEAITWKENEKGLGADLNVFERKPELEKTQTMDFILQDIENLLRLEFQEFWTQIYENESILKFVDHFLCYSRRPFENPLSSWTEKDIRQRTFQLLVRLSKDHEGSEVFSEVFEENFHSSIWDNSVWDIPRILDVCCLYGSTNKDKCRSLVGRIMQSDQYQKELIRVLEVIRMSMADFRTQEKTHGNGEILLDMIVNVDALLEVYPQACSLLPRPLLTELVVHFENVLPHLPLPPQPVQKHQLRIARIMWKYLEHNFVGALSKKEDEEKNAAAFCRVLGDAVLRSKKLGPKRPGLFLDVLFASFSKVEVLLTRFRKNGLVEPHMLEAFGAHLEEEAQTPLVENYIDQSQIQGSKLVSSEEASVAQLQNLFQCSPSFARALLAHFGGNLNAAVDAYLEGKLPAHLADVNRATYSASSPNAGFAWSDEEEESDGHVWKSDLVARMNALAYEDEADDTYTGHQVAVDTPIADLAENMMDFSSANVNRQGKGEGGQKSRPFVSAKDVDARRGGRRAQNLMQDGRQASRKKRFKNGDTVLIDGLTSEEGEKLNGKSCCVVRYAHGLWVVDVDGEKYEIHEKNLKRPKKSPAPKQYQRQNAPRGRGKSRKAEEQQKGGETQDIRRRGQGGRGKGKGRGKGRFSRDKHKQKEKSNAKRGF